MSLEEWARANKPELTLVFTDIVESTEIGIKRGDDNWIEDLFQHFDRARQETANYDCYVVKAIGDSFMLAFRNSTDAVRCAIRLSIDTGVQFIGIRAGINSGTVVIRENDIYGLNVNYTSRMQHSIEKEGIVVSNNVMRDVLKRIGTQSKEMKFIKANTPLKNFGIEQLWRVVTPEMARAYREQREARLAITNPTLRKLEKYHIL